MDWGTIIAAAVTAICALVGNMIANRRQTALIEYRLKALEDKVGRHNNLEARTVVLETKMDEVQRHMNQSA
jgi:hypothetical protein